MSLGTMVCSQESYTAIAFVYESLTPEIVVAVAVAFVITNVLAVPGPKEPALLPT
jgi:hypothetical protein